MEKKLAKLLHDLDGMTNYMECMEELTDDSELMHNFRSIKKKIEDSKSYIIESTVREVMGAYDRSRDTAEGKRDINLREALRLIKLVEMKAVRENVRVIIAVFNTGARPVAIHCMDDAFIASYDIAVKKAFTSAALKMSTRKLKTLSQPGASLYGIQQTNEGNIIIFGGGEPLYDKGRLIGSIGVSGSTEEIDTALAEYAKNKLEEVI